MIYLDSAATSWPKPDAVKEAVMKSLDAAGNPGRSGHRMSLDAARSIHQTRWLLSSFLGARSAAQVVFTLNATDALNMAIKGLVRPGMHVITTCLEHNSILRPLYALERRGQIQLTVLPLADGHSIDPEQFAAAMRPETGLVAVNHASNVTGAILDVAAIGAICRQLQVRLLVDVSQTAGILPIDVLHWNAACVAGAGHKGLLGPQGTGFLYVRDDVELSFWREGGTGSISDEVLQPEFMPDRLEAGTPNTPGIAGLGAGIEYIQDIGLEKIRAHELQLTEQLRAGFRQIPGLTLYGPGGEASVGVVSVNLEGWDGAELAFQLEQEYGILTRPGLHCAPLAHKAIGTFPQGTVRFSVGYATTVEDVEQAINAVRQLAVK